MAQNLVFFEGLDAAGDYGLWVTDGTAVGTQELSPISGAYQGPVGLQPNNISILSGTLAFSGTDAAGDVGLWVSNGTAAGTQELIGINGIYNGPSGLDPSDLTIFNGDLFFNGADASGGKGLWVTSGTATSTHELTGIRAANSGGLNPSGMTVFNGEVLLSANDTAGSVGLWVTNGTAAGTQELTGINGAFAGGILSPSFALPLSPDFTVFSNEVLFEGDDQAGNYGLWVTNGTAAGTSELTGIDGASSRGIFSFVFSPDFVVFNSLVSIEGGTPFTKSQVLFNGTDAAGNDSLWSTNGTAGGTFELTGINGANIFGLFYAVSYPDFTVFNGEVLFDGTDAAGNNGLWITNGTPGGTHELTGINGASANGIFSQVSEPNFTLLNGKVLFEGTDAAGNNSLWGTDGTVAGTHELTGISGTNSTGLNPSDLMLDGVVISFLSVVSTISAVTSTHAASASSGQAVTVTVTTTEPVTVTGAPTLQLNDNDAAYYTGGSGSNALTFIYMPVPGDNAADLRVTGLNVPSGASILDANGNSLSGPLSGDLGLTITGNVAPATVAQEINGLYVTLYGLAATQAGISYWESVLQNFDASVTAANAATTAISVNDETYLGQQMTASSPVVNGQTYFQSLYPTTMSDMAFVQALYQNMSNFIGTVAGDNYWLSLLQQAEASNGNNVTAARESVAGQFVHDFLGNNLTVGAAALGVSQSDYTALVNGQEALLGKAAVSQYYATETQASGGAILSYTAVTSPAFTAAENVVAEVTSAASSVAVAITGINNVIAHQSLSMI